MAKCICIAISRTREGLPRIENIESDDEYEAAADRFDELLMTKCLMIFNHLYYYFV